MTKTKRPQATSTYTMTASRDSSNALTEEGGQSVPAPSPGVRTHPQTAPHLEYPLLPRVLAALLYAVSSFFIVICNKLVLTNFRFPSFLALGIGQMLMTLCLLLAGRLSNLMKFPAPSKDILVQIMPLPVFFFGTIIFGLAGTMKLSLPMFIALRRFSNLFIMAGEYIVLGVVASAFIQFTVFLMVFGAGIAASNDLSFDFAGYTYLLAANLCSAATGVYSMQKLNMKGLDKNGLIFYNNLCVLLPTFLLAYCLGDIHKALDFTQWRNPEFVLQFLLACILGFVVTYSIMLCTQYNSALTTSMVGVIKNLVATYVGMFMGDYHFSVVNFTGINISAAGGVMYSYATFLSKPKPSSGTNYSISPA